MGGCVYLGLLVFELERVFHTQRVEGILDCKSQNRQPVSKEWREGGRDIERACECGWVCLSSAADLRASRHLRHTAGGGNT